MRWYEWRHVRERLITFGRAIQGVSPYRVEIETDSARCPMAYCDYTRRLIVVNPGVFPAAPPKDQYNLTRALLVHEAGHRRFTTPVPAGPLLRRVINILEDQRVENLMGETYSGLRHLIRYLAHTFYTTSPALSPDDHDRTQVLAALLQVRWAEQLGLPLKGALSPANRTLFRRCLRLAKQAWHAPDTETVKSLAQRIIAILGIANERAVPPWVATALDAMADQHGQRDADDKPEPGDTEGRPAPEEAAAKNDHKKREDQDEQDEQDDHNEEEGSTEAEPGAGNDDQTPQPDDQQDPEERQDGQEDEERDTEHGQDVDDGEKKGDDTEDGDQEDDGTQDEREENSEDEGQEAESTQCEEGEPSADEEPEWTEPQPPDDETPTALTVDTADTLPEDTFAMPALPSTAVCGHARFLIHASPYIALVERMSPLAQELADELALAWREGGEENAARGQRLSIRDLMHTPDQPFRTTTEMRQPPRMTFRLLVDHSTSMNVEGPTGKPRIASVVEGVMMLHLFACMAEIEHVVAAIPNDVRLADLHSGELGLAFIAGLDPALTWWEDVGRNIQVHAKELLARPEELKLILVIHDGYPNDADLARQVCRTYKDQVEIVGIGIDLDQECADRMARIFPPNRLVLCPKPEDLPRKLAALIRSIYGL